MTVEASNVHKNYLLGATAVGALRGVDLSVRRDACADEASPAETGGGDPAPWNLRTKG